MDDLEMNQDQDIDKLEKDKEQMNIKLPPRS
jgi:hypothetical protein